MMRSGAIRERTKAGIEAVRERGVRFGRPHKCRMCVTVADHTTGYGFTTRTIRNSDRS